MTIEGLRLMTPRSKVASSSDQATRRPHVLNPNPQADDVSR